MLRHPPLAAYPSPCYSGTAYEFSASATDPYGYSLTYTINWGDGSTPTVTSYPYGIWHTWSTEGEKWITVTAQSQNGVSSSSYYNVYVYTPGVTYHSLTTNAINNYGQPGNVPLYIDGEYVGTTGYTYSVTEGNHQIGVASPIYDGHYHVFYCYYYDGNYNYNNPMTLSVTKDKTITACYYTYW